MPKPRELGNNAKGLLEDITEIAEKIQPQYLTVTTLIIAGKEAEAAAKLEKMAAGNHAIGKALFLLLMDCHEQAREIIAAYRRETK